MVHYSLKGFEKCYWTALKSGKKTGRAALHIEKTNDWLHRHAYVMICSRI